MSAEILRQAASLMRKENVAGQPGTDTFLAVADWLEIESRQPETEQEGGAYTTGGPSLMALRVARAYLGESA